jgi:DNA polymerase-3 subunit gamma/tau
VGLRQALSDYAGDELYEPQLLERLAGTLAPEDVQLYYQTAITGRRDLPLAPDPRSGFEMTLLRMIAFRPSGESSDARPAATGAAVATGAAAAAGAGAALGGATKAGASGSATGGAGSAAAGAAGAGTTAAGTSEASAWAAIVGQLELTGAARQLASHCVFLGRHGATVSLGLDPHHQLVRTPATEEKLTQALARHFGAPVRLEFRAAEAAGAETPALLARRVSDAELAAAQRAFEEDPAVKGLRERFGATVLPETVRPVK